MASACCAQSMQPTKFDTAGQTPGKVSLLQCLVVIPDGQGSILLITPIWADSLTGRPSDSSASAADTDLVPVVHCLTTPLPLYRTWCGINAPAEEHIPIMLLDLLVAV